MLLSVTLDESPDGLMIRLKHTAFSRESGTELREISGRAIDHELKLLAKYLKQSFHLPTLRKLCPRRRAARRASAERTRPLRIEFAQTLRGDGRNKL
jgi:hypothetical protein